MHAKSYRYNLNYVSLKLVCGNPHIQGDGITREDPDRALTLLPYREPREKSSSWTDHITGSTATLSNSEDLKRETVSEDPHRKVTELKKFHNSTQCKILHFYVKQIQF